MDKIGIFKGKPISTMTREELLDFAGWAAKELARLNKVELEAQDFLIKKEIGKHH